jgi:hypothetical protein
MIKYIIIAIVLCATIDSHGRQKTRRISQADLAIELRIVFGEKITVFDIGSKPVPYVNFSNNNGEQSLKNVKLKDYQFLVKKVNALSGRSDNVYSKCSRAFIQLNAQNKIYSGCLQGKSKLSEDLRNLANILSLLF